MLAGGKIRHVHQPILDSGLGDRSHVHLLQAGFSSKMENGECPDLLSIASVIAINPGWTHSRIAGKVISNDVVLL